MDAMRTSVREQLLARRRELSPKQIDLMRRFTAYVEAWYAEPDRVPLESLIELVPDGAVRAEMRSHNLFSPAWRAFAEALVDRQHRARIVFDSQHGCITPNEIVAISDNVARYERDGKEFLEASVGNDPYGNPIWPSRSPEHNYRLRMAQNATPVEHREPSPFRQEWNAYGLDPEPFDEEDA